MQLRRGVTLEARYRIRGCPGFRGLAAVRLLALGADREQGVAHLLDLIASEMKVAMTLTGARAVGKISRESLVRARDPLMLC